MKVYLEPNWSEQFIYGDKTPGFFVGREQEIKGLKNVIKNNDSSAILISSIRGVGKSSFVHRALTDLDDILPVFINIGHTLSNEDIKKQKQKKLILTSLIRAIHFNSKFEKDKDLKKIYEKSLGVYKKEKKHINQNETRAKMGTNIAFRLGAKNLIPLFGIFLSVLGLSLSGLLWRLIVIFLGVSMVYFSWEKSWAKSLLQKESILVDDSTEYLEIEFEKWLKKSREKSPKIIFVIDELDKIDEKKSFEIIKEYKNLFTRSFAHFIFISSHKAFDLVGGDREKSAEEGGIFPTFFTHVFYLSLPKTEEIKSYINEILVQKRKSKKKEEDELISYLLFRSKNDFFDLKRLIADVSSFDSNEKLFIDTAKIKEGDPRFSKVAGLFEYVDTYFLKRRWRELKKYWEENSNLQKEVLKFLNNHFDMNFSHNEDIKNNTNLENLVDFLIEIGALEKRAATAESDIEEGDFEYIWTNKYKRSVKAPLLEEDKKFSSAFNKLVKVANDLDDLPDNYSTGEFSDFGVIKKGRDGQDLSGIDLYSSFSDYQDIFKKLEKSSQRITVTIEKIQEATKIINEQVDNVYNKYFDIVTNLLNGIFEEQSEIFRNENITSGNYDINNVFSSLPDFVSVITPDVYQSIVCGKTDQTKYVLLIRNFEDQEHIHNALSVLKGKKDILIINLVHSNKHQISSPKIYIDKLGRKRKKAMEVKNFVNFEFNNFRQLSEILTQIEKYLS